MCIYIYKIVYTHTHIYIYISLSLSLPLSHPLLAVNKYACSSDGPSPGTEVTFEALKERGS